MTDYGGKNQMREDFPATSPLLYLSLKYLSLATI